MDKDVEAADQEMINMGLKKRKRVDSRVKRPPGEISKFLDIKQVLDLIPVSKSTLYSMCGKGMFPKPIKIGRLSLWSKEIVNKWVDDKLAL